jgi:hypothetical protein
MKTMKPSQVEYLESRWPELEDVADEIARRDLDADLDAGFGELPQAAE